MEFLALVGIATPPTDYEFRYYSPNTIRQRNPVVDTKELAEDASKLLGIPFGLAHRVFEVEVDFLRMRGLA
jgi:hypothetical protein